MLEELLQGLPATVDRPMYREMLLAGFALRPTVPLLTDGYSDLTNVGVTRLNKVLHYIKTLPRHIPELGRRMLPDKQWQIACCFVCTCLPQIVSPSQWISHQGLYLTMLRDAGVLVGERSVSNMGGVLAPRQNGKSWTIAVCCAAMMLSCPGISIAIYACKILQAEVFCPL